ncbi:hypothetical protein [Bdellovibrio svalbardensis]|uniref:Lipocalin-like domain-containing protein n=1 Tax=Bdellovibrio svalbardensis TaxID=2972972 RepID=A0ABT6DLR5_9BACT|nr:hypothetical protein [Bdellovibrio svalbardensis]MDG0816859.1 hypothetical protein [Bdellovibrio svalbardensis]
MKVLVASLVLLAASSSFAASASNFEGSYRLTKSQVDGDTFCYNGIIIAKEENQLAFYRADISYSPLFKAEVNGEARAVSGSHGEAMSSYKGTESVTLDAKGLLTFEFKAVNKFLGIPATREKETNTLQLSKDGKKLRAVRATFEGPVAGIGKRAKALCEYDRE